MVSKCKKKMGRQTWSEETMQQAIRAVKENKMGWLKASQLYNIPRTTLRRRARKLKNAGGISKSPLKSKTAQPREAKEDSAPVIKIKEETLTKTTAPTTVVNSVNFNPFEVTTIEEFLTVDIAPDVESPTAQERTRMNTQKMLSQQYCLRWKYHHNNLQVMFSQLLERESFCDVTLACEGKTLRAHKVVLSACSTYFDMIFSQYEEKNPIVILKDVKFSDIKALVEFMYKGEINVDHSHLASLLKTAEDLRIKGLAEVSWRSDNHTSSPPDDIEHTEGIKNNSDVEPAYKKRKSHQMDMSAENFSPQVASISGAGGQEEVFIHDNAAASPERNKESWDEPEPEVVPCDPSAEVRAPTVTNILQQPTLQQAAQSAENMNDNGESDKVTPAVSEGISPRIAEQYRDVIKLNDYLTTGRRPQFWEEPFTKRVMEAIKGKELEMKTGAELLGVSYGTLYGRYRDAYGCLKHPYRVRDFWSESGPADVLAKVQRKEITLFRAAEMLNVTVTTLANYLSTLRRAGSSSGDEAMDEVRGFEDSFLDAPTPKRSAPRKLVALENNPDITIVKQEPINQNLNHDTADEDGNSSHSSLATNNNAEHSDSNHGENDLTTNGPGRN